MKLRHHQTLRRAAPHCAALRNSANVAPLKLRPHQTLRRAAPHCAALRNSANVAPLKLRPHQTLRRAAPRCAALRNSANVAPLKLRPRQTLRRAAPRCAALQNSAKVAPLKLRPHQTLRRAALRGAVLPNSANVTPLGAAQRVRILFFGILIMHGGEFFYDTWLFWLSWLATMQRQKNAAPWKMNFSQLSFRGAAVHKGRPYLITIGLTCWSWRYSLSFFKARRGAAFGGAVPLEQRGTWKSCFLECWLCMEGDFLRHVTLLAIVIGHRATPKKCGAVKDQLFPAFFSRRSAVYLFATARLVEP